MTLSQRAIISVYDANTKKSNETVIKEYHFRNTYFRGISIDKKLRKIPCD